ncbi:hypothetical protein FACS1894122_05140 [Alphaproteobacteria bacterium]|nr:hypothetical protein FACS1894122_05140 [Alphaproteobacteria bacterium]
MIGGILAVVLLENTSYSMEIVPTTNHESQGDSSVIDRGESDKIHAIRSLQIEHSEKNMEAFSEPFELSSPLLDGSFNVRKLTAESILKGLDAHIDAAKIAFYKGLLTTSPENSYPLILQEYRQLVERSIFVDVNCVDGPYVYRRKQPTTANIAKFMTMVDASLRYSEAGRKSLILFLAANECMKTRAPQKALMLESSGYMSDYIKKPIVSLKQWSGGIFIESTEEPTMEYPFLTIGCSDMQFNIQGLVPALTLVSGSMKITLLNALMHEFNHGTHTSLGLGNYSLPFLENYFANPFLKELMFNRLEDLKSIIGQKISTALNQFGKDNCLLELFRKTMQDFLIDYAGSGVKVSPITADILQQKDEFMKELTHKLALRAIGEMWHCCSEETNNLIGIQLVENTLFINTLSDMDCSLEKMEAIRWPYEAHAKFATSAVFEADLELTINGLAPDADIEAWFKKIVCYCYDNGIGKPTERAWKTLLELHSVTQ